MEATEENKEQVAAALRRIVESGKLKGDSLKPYEEGFEAFKDEEQLSTEKLLRSLTSRDDGPWAIWWGRDMAEASASPDRSSDILKRVGAKLAKKLSAFPSVAPTKLRDGDKTYRGYRKADFETAWSRYLLPLSTNDGTHGTSQVDAHIDDGTASNDVPSRKPSLSRHVPSVPSSNDRGEAEADALQIPPKTLRRWLKQGNSTAVLPTKKAEQVKLSHAKSALRDSNGRKEILEALDPETRDAVRADLMSIDAPTARQPSPVRIRDWLHPLEALCRFCGMVPAEPGGYCRECERELGGGA